MQMQILSAAGRIGFDGWMRGVIGAFISGGSSSIAAGTAATWLDKGHDMNVFELMGLTFLVAGVISLAKFLETTPLPPVAPPSPPASQQAAP